MGKPLSQDDCQAPRGQAPELSLVSRGAVSAPILAAATEPTCFTVLMRFVETAADTDGALLRIETVNPPTGVAEPKRVHPRQETRAEVVSGRFALCRRR
jgi:hypothetical protein